MLPKRVSVMNSAFLAYSRPAEVVAKSLLDVWLSGNRHHLRTVLEDIALMPFPLDINHEFERVDLLKCVAWRMKESEEIFTPYAESPQTKVWFDLLRHLSAPSSGAGKLRDGNPYFNSAPAVLRYQTSGELKSTVDQTIE
jgi:hypothetical protein